MLRPGPTAAAISGSLGAMVWMPTALGAFSTTCGRSTLQRTNGPGWVETARSAATDMARTECTAHWGYLLPGTFPEAAIALRPGPTAAAISGSLGALASMTAPVLVISMTFGSSILPRTNGPGWAEIARPTCPECTARWEYPLPETFPEAAISLRTGPIAAAISGSLGGGNS